MQFGIGGKGLLWRKVLDSEGKRCGVVCGIEFDKMAGAGLRANSVLAKSGRSSLLLPTLLKIFYNDRVVDIGWNDVQEIKRVVRLRWPIRLFPGAC